MASSHARRAPVSNETAMQALKLGELPAAIAAVARPNEWAVFDIERANTAQKSAPTLLLFRPGDGFVFIKCLGDSGKLSKNQRDWHTFITDSGGRAVVVRPSDLLWIVDCLRLAPGTSWPARDEDRADA